VRLDLIFGQVGHPEAGERRIEAKRDVVEHHLPFDAYVHLAATLLEFPDIQSAPRRHAEIDAPMRREVLRNLRTFARREITRGSDDRHAHVGTDADRDQSILRQRRAQIDEKQKLPNLPGQALYLARNAVMISLIEWKQCARRTGTACAFASVALHMSPIGTCAFWT
jgi:hypothetical protein